MSNENLENILKRTAVKLNPSNIIVSKSLNEEDYIYFAANIRPELLHDKARNILGYIQWYRDNYKKHPTLEELALKFDSILDIVDLDFDSNLNNALVADKVRSEFQKNKMMNILEDFSIRLDSDDVNSSINFFNSEMAKISAMGINTKSNLSLLKNASNIFKLKPESGYSYGLPSLDRNIGGIKRNEYVIICARPKGNKSFFARFIALNLLRQGCDVIYLSFETSMNNEMRNFLALDSGINPFHMLTNILSDAEKNKLQKSVTKFESMAQSQSFEILDTTCIANMTPNGIFNAIKPFIIPGRENKTFVFLDQASWLYDDENSNNPVQILSNVSKSFVSFTSKTGIPLIALFQASRDNLNKKIIPGPRDIQWSDRPLQDCHVALGLGATPDMIRDNKKYIKTIAHRIGEDACLEVEFNIREGKMRELDGDCPDPDESSNAAGKI